ncbi:MAG: hypothetical protein SFV51_16150 [Bryobacteraceae bacterium]|nr:hypothetical protein [Bryobacteraceae bacterium]
MSRIVNATDFRAKCLSYLDEMDRQGAFLSPAPKLAWKSPRDTWTGRATIEGDIVDTNLAGLCHAARQD